MSRLVTLVGTCLPRAASPFFPDFLWRIATTDRAAYLTFDDGPNPEHTGRIMDVLSRYGARGTFFVVGSRCEKHPEVVRALLDAGHSIGNHTYSHLDGWRSSKAALLSDLERTTDLLEQLMDRPVSWMRPPYGRFTRAMRAWCRRRRQKLTMWDIGPGDFLDFVSMSDVVRHVQAYIRPGSIIALHDNPRSARTTPEALQIILERMTSEGWRFPPLPALS